MRWLIDSADKEMPARLIDVCWKLPTYHEGSSTYAVIDDIALSMRLNEISGDAAKCLLPIRVSEGANMLSDLMRLKLQGKWNPLRSCQSARWWWSVSALKWAKESRWLRRSWWMIRDQYLNTAKTTAETYGLGTTTLQELTLPLKM